MTKKERHIIRYLLEATAVVVIAVLASAVLALHLTRPPMPYNRQAPAFGTTVQARVEAVLEETQNQDETGLITVQQRLRLRVLSGGEYQGEVVTVTYNGMGPTRSAVRFEEGSRALVMISEMPTNQGEGTETVYQVADHVRLRPLALLAAIFAMITVAIGRWQGLRALIGLAISVLLIGGFIMPQILAQRDPVLITLLSSGLLLAVTLYLIQGWNVPGHTALLGMLVSLAVTGGLAILWSQVSYLTGFGSEETLFIQSAGVGIQMRGLLLAGMILGAAGVLDDVIIAQAVTVFELHAADARLRRRQLFQRGMRIGVAHLTSMVNTLVLAYASTALPLLVLFFLYPEPWHLTINRELIAEEVIRTLVGSLGLMLAVPLTTAIAAWVAPKFTPPPKDA